MLHITNGDGAAQVMRQAGLAGEILPWRDVLHEGPVPQGVPPEELRAIRARFIAACWLGPFEEVLRDFAHRDQALEDSLAQEEVVLWFEHDLYDQLQLLQVLDRFADPAAGSGRDGGGPRRLSLVCGAEYLGSAAPERLRQLFPGRRPVSAAQLDLARRAWGAFRSADPRGLLDLTREDTSALPFLRGALVRHLEQFPSVRNGLSRSETQALEAIAGGETRLERIYVASHHRREEAIFLGDATFALHLEGLSRSREPLVVRVDGGRLEAPRGNEGGKEFWTSEVRLTEAGRAVLEGRKDRVELNGLDRWLGGVHLHAAGGPGSDVEWRWDGDARGLRRRPLAAGEGEARPRRDADQKRAGRRAARGEGEE